MSGRKRPWLALVLLAVLTSVVALAPTSRSTSPTSTEPGSTRKRSYKVGREGTLELQVPVEWTEKVTRGTGSVVFEVVFGNKGKEIELMVWVALGTWASSLAHDPEAVRQLVEFEMRTGSTSEEISLKLFKVHGDSAEGYMYAAEDQASSEAGYRYQWRGLLTIGQDAVARVTLLSNARDSREAIEGHQAIKSIRWTKR